MRKNKLSFILAGMPLLGALLIGLSSFKDLKHTPSHSSSLSPQQAPCDNKPGGTHTGEFSSLSTNFVSHNFTLSSNGTTAQFDLLNLCYVPSATPPWTINQYIGVLAPAYRPSGTRSFSGYWPGTPSITVQFTLYSNGELYMQQTGGTTMARNAQITASTSYAL